MKAIARIGLILIGAALVGCGANTPIPPGGATSAPATAGRLARSDASSAGRISLADATAAVRKEVFRIKPTMNPDATFPLEEKTTDEIWKRLHIQMFRVTDGVWGSEFFIIQNGQAIHLGSMGITSMCVADLNGDGQKELLFTYSTGSGRGRSIVGVWISGTAEIDATPGLWDGELMLKKTDDQHVSVMYELSQDKGEFGTLGMSGKEHSTLTITLNPNLPERVVSLFLK